MAEDRVRPAGIRSTAVIACIAGLALGLAGDSHARVTRIVFGPPTYPYSSATFGSVGQYEQLDGIAYGEIDPADPLNSVIQDIELAPRNARGLVEYSTNVSILKPVDMNGANRAMLLEIVNRGNKLDPGFYNVGVTSARPQGDGFLEKQGFTMVWVGWQADLAPLASLVTMSAPIAQQRNGRSITGPVRAEFILRPPPITIPPTPLPNTQPILADSSSNTPGYALSLIHI